MTVLEEKQREMDKAGDRLAECESILQELWDSREPASIYGLHTGSYRLHADSDQTQRIQALLGIKEE